MFLPPPISDTLLTYTSGVIHRARLTNLTPATRYHYLVGSPAGGWSDTQSFVSNPGVGADVAVRIAVLADVAQLASSVAVVDALVNSTLLAGVNGGAVICGDLAYANGDETLWDAWQAFMEPLAASLPVMTNAGNQCVRLRCVGDAWTARQRLLPHEAAQRASAAARSWLFVRRRSGAPR